MRTLITDLLDVARIETGTLSVSAEASQVSFLADRARSSLLSGDGRNNLQIEMELDLPPGDGGIQQVALQHRVVLRQKCNHHRGKPASPGPVYGHCKGWLLTRLTRHTQEMNGGSCRLKRSRETATSLAPDDREEK